MHAQVGAINAAMSSLVKTLNVFPKERAIVSRERAKGSYAAAPYFLSKLAAESPIGALFPLLFAAIVYPAAGLHPKLSRCPPAAHESEGFEALADIPVPI